MTTYFVGGGLDSYRLSPSQPTWGSSTSVYINGGVAQYCYADLVNPATGAPATATDLWLHFSFDMGNYTMRDGRRLFQIINDTGQEVLSATGDPSSNGMVIYYGPSATLWKDFDNLGPGYNTIDLHVVVGVSGKLELFMNGSLVQSSAMNTSAMGNLATVAVGGRSAEYQQMGPLLVASYNTVGHSVVARHPSGNGPEQVWAGDYTSVNSNGNIDDTHNINTSTTGAVSTFTGDDFAALPAGAVIKAVGVGNRVRALGGASPANVAAVLNIAGTDYVSPYDMPISAGFSGTMTIFENDPSTAAPWGATLAHINGQAFGVKAAA